MVMQNPECGLDYVVIVAGGSGRRMGSDVPKQFLEIEGKPILMHTIERFRAALPEAGLVLVLPQEQMAYWDRLCRASTFAVSHTVVKGGATRFHSVLNGLNALPEEEKHAVVAIHDGVRPFVASEVIRHAFQLAHEGKNVVPVLSVVESLRRIDGETGLSHAVNRQEYYAVQTPQVFPLEVLRRAYRQTYHEGFTDDASVVEQDGGLISLIPGNRENIKITTPFDLAIAREILSGKGALT